MRHGTAHANGIRLHYVTAGDGPPLYLLHGWPQTWYAWRKVIPALAERFTVVAPDLRGYGASDRPAAGYDKRTMAADIRALARALGHDRIHLAGHDRGARVAHRFALDHPDALRRLALLDIVPTRVVWETMDDRAALGSWHWLFNAVPDLPELLVGANIEAFLRHFYREWCFQRGAFTAEDIAVYVHAFSAPGALRGGFEDYRAGATLDLEHDRADAGEAARIRAPTLVLWAAEYGLARRHDVLAVWRASALDVRGEEIAACGHFMAEEQPELVADRLLTFFAEDDAPEVGP